MLSSRARNPIPKPQEAARALAKIAEVIDDDGDGSEQLLELLTEIVGEGTAVPHLCEGASRFVSFPSVLVRDCAGDSAALSQAVVWWRERASCPLARIVDLTSLRLVCFFGFPPPQHALYKALRFIVVTLRIDGTVEQANIYGAQP